MEPKQGSSNFFNRHPIVTILSGFVILLIIIGVVSSGNNSGNSNSSPTNTAPSTQAAQNQPADPCTNFDQNTATSSVSYAELEKDPEKYIGTSAVYSGEIVQIQEAPDGTGIIRLAVTKTSYGWDPNDIIYITYSGGTNAVDNDVVKVYGQLTGSETYTSQANYQITIPSMNACVITDKTQSQSTSPTPVPTTQTTPAASPTPTPAPVAPAPPAAPTTPKSWHSVTTVTTANTENTPPFTIQGSEWRATWSCQAAIWDQYSTTPDISAVSTSGGFPDEIADPTTCPSGDTTYFYDGPGTYYLKIDIYTATTVTVSIEDYY